MKQMIIEGANAHDTELILLISNGWTAEQIARRTMRTPEQIYQRARKLRIDFQRELRNSWRRGNRATTGANGEVTNKRPAIT